MAAAIETARAISPAVDSGRLERLRLRLDDGCTTTLHVARFDRGETRTSVVRFSGLQRLADWCTRARVPHALVGGFFVRSGGRPLGELRLDGIVRDYAPFAAPWGAHRACLRVDRGRLEIGSRPRFGTDPIGDLLQAGPLLVEGRRSVLGGVRDPEGFSATAHQFDSDITAGRYPRAAMGITDDHLLAVACDGRAPGEAGLTLVELGEAMASLGSRTAINLDGGGSTSLVFDGILRNTPREEHGVIIPGGRPVATALAFEPARFDNGP
jgi:Phosphodiester glycosidase